MADIIVEPVGEAEQTVLDGWLDDAARWNIDVTDVATIDAAYESCLLYTSPSPRD